METGWLKGRKTGKSKERSATKLSSELGKIITIMGLTDDFRSWLMGQSPL
jgi:hypothetical protein